MVATPSLQAELNASGLTTRSESVSSAQGNNRVEESDSEFSDAVSEPDACFHDAANHAFATPSTPAFELEHGEPIFHTPGASPQNSAFVQQMAWLQQAEKTEEPDDFRV